MKPEILLQSKVKELKSVLAGMQSLEEAQLKALSFWFCGDFNNAKKQEHCVKLKDLISEYEKAIEILKTVKISKQ